ncbi:MAG: hypothetical protein LQ342_002819 [Letrouitia transgressa]|nr:MAG: hypothetical protein LQ342_002819 [Letrouitia transgressa]
MSLTIKPAAETDILRILQIRDAAFAQDPWQRIMKPNLLPPHSRVKAIERFRKEYGHDPAVHFLVVEDKDTDEIVAVAKWNIYKTERPESDWKKEPEIEWDEGTNNAAITFFLNGIFRRRHKNIGGKAHLALDMLDTHPDHQRKGAGRQLVKWGTDIADEAGLPIYLEATPSGLKLYRSMGFVDIESFDIDMAAWGGQGIHRHICMVRPAKA